jgi:hypothetical protein
MTWCSFLQPPLVRQLLEIPVSRQPLKDRRTAVWDHVPQPRLKTIRLPSGSDMTSAASILAGSGCRS